MCVCVCVCVCHTQGCRLASATPIMMIGTMMAASIAVVMSVLIMFVSFVCCCCFVCLYYTKCIVNCQCQSLVIPEYSGKFFLAIQFNDSLENRKSNDNLKDDKKHCCLFPLLLSLFVCLYYTMLIVNCQYHSLLILLFYQSILLYHINVYLFIVYITLSSY